MDSKGQLMGVPIKLVMALVIGTMAMGVLMQFMGTAERTVLRDMKVTFSTDREQLYELLPPPPIQSQPGLSVFHDFSIKEVRYGREDPAGWFGSSSPTPIPLWFIGVTLWWAQWDITLELEDGAIEEVFDFDNPTLPLTHEAMGEEFITHKPLAHRREVSRNTFNFRLVIISLRSFSIS